MIQRASLDGSQVETIVSGLDDPEGIALDAAGGEVYWTESESVKRASLDGSQVETLFSKQSMGIALDLEGGKIYWSEWIEDRIRRANLDGSQVETIVTGLQWPRDVALSP